MTSASTAMRLLSSAATQSLNASRRCLPAANHARTAADSVSLSAAALDKGAQLSCATDASQAQSTLDLIKQEALMNQLKRQAIAHQTKNYLAQLGRNS